MDPKLISGMLDLLILETLSPGGQLRLRDYAVGVESLARGVLAEGREPVPGFASPGKKEAFKIVLAGVRRPTTKILSHHSCRKKTTGSKTRRVEAIHNRR